MKNSAYIIETEQGNFGIIKHNEQLVNGKYVLFLTTREGEPVLDDKGQQKKILVHRNKIHIRGFIN